MFNKVIFYNHFGNGDLFESREFVRDMMELLPAKEYFYAHQKSPRMFADIPKLKHIPLDAKCIVTQDIRNVNKDLYINTWIGRDSKYVLPKIGCVVDKSWEMFNDMLGRLNLPRLSKPFQEYIPRVNFESFQLDSLKNFLSTVGNKRKVLICNGRVFSLQAENFNFSPIMDYLASKYEDTIFIATQREQVQHPNLFYTEHVIKTDDGFDLNEISYLATKCDTIIGRKSGPFCFAHPIEVWNDGTKDSLSFTYGKEASHFVRHDIFPLRKHWSPEISYHGVVSAIERILK